MTQNPREIAVEILFEVIINGRSLSEELPKYSDHEKIPVIKEYCFGVCRWYFQCQQFLKQLLSKPIKEKNADIEVLLMLGIYELQHMTTAQHAVVNECVNTAISLKHQWAKGLVNAILRSFIREKDELKNDELSHSKWFIDQLKQDWPNNWRDIIGANNQYPPMILRANQRQNTVEGYLTTHDIDAQSIEHYPDAILLNKPCPVKKLPQFEEGSVSVQDCSAQCAIDFLQLAKDQHVLDACAAPGGKTCHIAERYPDLASLTAVDIDAYRTQLITDNLSRLKLSAKVKVGDASDPSTWWDTQQFDRILLDAPCSATGVIRRHPDIKLHRTIKDIDQLAGLQRKLLRELWPLLKPGGMMLYITCSVLHNENLHNIKTFLDNTTDAQELTLEHPDAVACQHGIQFLPKNSLGDGFYYCMLQKT